MDMLASFGDDRAVDGPKILARSLSSAPARKDENGNRWQYHPRSDRHSKIACWGILFDLLRICPLLAEHASRGAVAYGINHEMRDFRNNRKKDLDLVLCTPSSGEKVGRAARSMKALVGAWNIALTPAESMTLAALPDLSEAAVGAVHVALEAKAAMTEHTKARPRLYDELNSSHLTIHGATDLAIAAGFVMINLAETFISPDRNKHDLSSLPPKITTHKQPRAAEAVIQKVREIPRRTKTGDEGFDALAIVVVDCRNDGSPVTVVEARQPAPPPGDIFQYESMIRRVGQLYEARFPRV